MNIMKAGYTIMRPKHMDERDRNAILSILEEAGRTCYKSEHLIGDGTASGFVRALVQRGHEAMLEHAVISVRWNVDIGIGREMTRHRIASFAQESTRYCNYSKNRFGKQVSVIKPEFFRGGAESYAIWKHACDEMEKAYFALLEYEPPQLARTVLNLSTKAELVSTMNLREWRYFFQLRAADMTGPAHPQMKQVTIPLLKELRDFLPEVFGDILLPEERDNG